MFIYREIFTHELLQTVPFCAAMIEPTRELPPLLFQKCHQGGAVRISAKTKTSCYKMENVL